MHIGSRAFLTACTLLISAQGCTSSADGPNSANSNTGVGRGGADSSSAPLEPNGGSDDNSRVSSGGSSAGGKSASATTRAATGGSSAKGGSGSRSAATVTGATSGGSSSRGGSSAKSGNAAGEGGGAERGGSGNGGGASTSAANQICAWTEGPTATNGRMTCYWFSQGTSKDQLDRYKTYCGYTGSQTGEKPQGTTPNWCPINDVVNTVENISTVHFAAIRPSQLGGEGNGRNCGMCVEVTYRARSLIATVIDSCPSCTSDQDIDLSVSAAKELGMNEMIGEVNTGVRWRVVACPTTSNIAVIFNGAPRSQMYFQNLAFPIAKASFESVDANNVTGYWEFGNDVVGKEVTLTDVMGHTITATIPANDGDLGVQFPLTCE